MLGEDVKKEQLRQSGGVNGVMRGDEYALLRQAIHDDKDGGESRQSRRCSMKSIEMEFHGHSGIGSCLSKP